MEAANQRLYLEEFPPRCYQICPFCGQRQIIMVRGISTDLETHDKFVVRDKGYSFCNCRNVFYTDYKNIDKSVYDVKYLAKYGDANLEHIAKINIEKFWSTIAEHNPNAKSFFEIGSVTDKVLDCAKAHGLKTIGLDLINRDSKHLFIQADVDCVEPKVYRGKQDIIYASHVVEHLKDPQDFLYKCVAMMHDDSTLHINMPDTFFINWEKPLDFDWWVHEHHILWNMVDFIAFAEEFGLKCVYKRRGIDMYKQIDGSWHWLQEFKAVFKLK